MNNNQIEVAARHYCQLKGLDADELIKHQPIVGINGPIDATPRWRLIANAVLDQHRLLEAIKVGQESS